MTEPKFDDIQVFAILNAVLDKRLSARELLKVDIETLKKVQNAYFGYLRTTAEETNKWNLKI